MNAEEFKQFQMGILGQIPGCINVERAELRLDRLGIDFVVKFLSGLELKVDAKKRNKGCSKYWSARNEPELALETWSVMPGGKYKIPKDRAKIGWTRNPNSLTSHILFTWHPEDFPYAYLYDFKMLHIVFEQNRQHWLRQYKVDVQETNEGWQSECVFVPEIIVRRCFDDVICFDTRQLQNRLSA